MFSECANPDCRILFVDFRLGTLFRFHKKSSDSADAPSNFHSVQHFWLCDRCSQTYTLEYIQDVGVLMHPHMRNSPLHRRIAAP
jgi:hypothetical protein